MTGNHFALPVVVVTETFGLCNIAESDAMVDAVLLQREASMMDAPKKGLYMT